MTGRKSCVAFAKGRDVILSLGERQRWAATASSGAHLNARKTALSCRSANRRFPPN
jgi:hypothetical protein